ncbi:Response regulators consisting of a CheY-like receiver domain and a winged-helix DNA-binding domain [Alteromonadaceae bacterium Bs31]|nr:Response regulators consisting of a CheY-like receiver domain and a winged-helix DNA-binding domain [Alteromonadaceae bacterium Bs31]
MHSILIIEDNPDNQQLATWILEDEGYQVSCVESAEEGLELLESNTYHLVLMDISLPGMDGKQATQKIRNTPHLKHLPVLALTAHAVQGERESIVASGVDGLLTKPVDEEELIKHIDSLLNN